MSSITRGARGVFRNTIRTTGVTIILALSVGLALVMLLALKTVQARINTVKSSIGNTISISPAGFNDFSSANNALDTTQLSKVASLAHITQVTETLTGRLTTIGSSVPSFGNQTQNSNATTSLTSPVKLQTGSGSGGGGGRVFINGGGSLPTNFSLPITVVGTSDPSSLNGTQLTLTSGATLSGTSNTNDALVSTDMASKNSLKVGSTFTAYNTKLTVAGIFSTSTQGDSNNVIVALPTEQRLSGQAGDVTSATATVDSVDNLASATTDIKNTLGSSNADVENSQQQVDTAIAPLQNIKTISTYSLIGALVAGSIIIFLTMLMIVRERRREIGVLKAIGSSNFKIVIQFVSEALTLTLFGAILGMIGGLVLSNPILSILVSSSTSSTTSSTSGGFRGGTGGGGGGFGGAAGRGFSRAIGGGAHAISNLHAAVGYDLLLYGLAAALIIAIIGSALPAWLIARVRPAEVLRGE
jgi:putative ABC transport system permease protein